MRRSSARSRADDRATSEKREGPPAIRVPHDAVNEMVLIAAVIVDEESRRRYLDTISPDFFFGQGHAAIWTALREIKRRDLHYDPATLKQLGRDIDVAYVEGLIKQRPVVPPNLKHHVAMLRWDAARVGAAQGPVTTFLELLKDPAAEPAALRGVAQAIANALTTGANDSLRNAHQLIEEQMGVIELRRQGVATYGFGIPGLDFYPDSKPRLVPGTAPKTLTVVTGVSGSGKTTAVARAVLGMWGAGRRVLYGAYEQGSGMSLELLATMDLGFSRTDMMIGAFNDADSASVRAKMEEIGGNVMFDEMARDSFVVKGRDANARAMDRIAQSIIDSRCDVYVADLFRRTLRETEPDDEERALYAMQELAKRLNVHLLLVQQQNAKQVENTRDKLPRRETIKGSGAWVEVADQIIAWHRPALWKNVPDDRIYSIVLKQRYGAWPMMIEHEWEPEFGSIEGGVQIEMQRHGDGDESEAEDGFWRAGKR